LRSKIEQERYICLTNPETRNVPTTPGTIQITHAIIYIEALNANLSSLSISAREKAAKDAAKKEAKAAAAETRDAERKAAAKVQIKRVERNKRKFVTVVSGLEAHGLDNKKIAKELGKKFATGSSVTKSPAGTEEITVQGDVSDDLFDWLVGVHGNYVPEDNIELVEDKKKKAG
jgi:density-regulated protein